MFKRLPDAGSGEIVVLETGNPLLDVHALEAVQGDVAEVGENSRPQQRLLAVTGLGLQPPLGRQPLRGPAMGRARAASAPNRP